MTTNLKNHFLSFVKKKKKNWAFHPSTINETISSLQRWSSKYDKQPSYARKLKGKVNGTLKKNTSHDQV